MKLLDKIKQITRPKVKNQLVSSQVTPRQLIEYSQGTGNLDVFNFYGVGTSGALRNQAIHFAAFLRVVSLLSSAIAQLLTTGSLRVINDKGEIDTSRSTVNLLGLMQHSPDGITPAFSFIEDLALDYLIEGNSLMAVERVLGRVSRLRRLNSYSAWVESTDTGGIIYKATDAYDFLQTEYKTYADLEIIHSRWGLVNRTTASSQRVRFAPAPIVLMRPALAIGQESDKYILDWYKTDSPRANFGISLQKPLDDAQKEQFYTQFSRAAKSRAPLLFGEGATFTNLNNNASGNGGGQSAQREFQVDEICRIYGVPGPLVNQQVTAWGSGIEELSKLFYRWGLRQHTERLLGAMKLKLLPRNYQFSIDEIDILRGDTTSIAAILTATRGDAQTAEIATTEERRRMVGLPVKPQYGTLKPLNNNSGTEEDNDEGNTE